MHQPTPPAPSQTGFGAGSGQRHNPLIDVLRAIAALAVLFYHVLALREWAGFPQTGWGLVARTGWVGVDLFFVISGFVIGKTALEGYRRNPQTWRADFAERRLRRIVPLYLATLALFIAFFNPQLMALGWTSVYQIGMHLGFVHNLWHETHGSINGPNWSVGLEMQFYVLVALCTPWIARSASWKVFAVWTAVALIWRFATLRVLPPGASEPILQFIYSSQLPGTLNEFVCGVCLAQLAERGKLLYTPRRMLGWAAAAVVLLGLAWATVLPEVQYWQSPLAILFWRGLVCMGFAALLACLVMLPPRGGWLVRPFAYLGEISYGIYLWHMPVLMTLVAKTPWTGWRLLAGTLAATLLLAALSWHGFEKRWLAPSRRQIAS
jgi:peptidoglycan/LPS O-acetylase OafA/YrhL